MQDVPPPTIGLAGTQQPWQNHHVPPQRLFVEETNMLAHRVRVTIPENHRVTIDVPVEVPAGDAEVIVLTGPSVDGTPPDSKTFEARFRPDPALGPIVFCEDPTAPVSEDDWPSDLRP
jgi:hypothetical protein